MVGRGLRDGVVRWVVGVKINMDEALFEEEAEWCAGLVAKDAKGKMLGLRAKHGSMLFSPRVVEAIT